MSLVAQTPVLERARVDAAQAAERAQAEIVEVHDLDALRDVSGLFDDIWGRDGASALVPFELLRAMSHGGNYVGAAYRDGSLLGAAFGFRASHHDMPALHSHILGVSVRLRAKGVGFALKQHQRRWCLERGLATMTWTFDPLVRPNAWFNFSRLGAAAHEYLPHFYGQMDDALNDGESDRVLVHWDLASDRASAAARRELPEPTLDEIDGYVPVLTDAGGIPVVEPGEGPRVRCQVPLDIVAVRSVDPELAANWRRTLREVMARRLADGYQIAGMTRDGWYLLAQDA